MAKIAKVDQYPNRAMQRVTMSGANTLTFAQVRFGVGLFQGIALVLHKIEYYPTLASIIELSGATDNLMMALTNRDDLTTLDAVTLNIIAKHTAFGLTTGAAASQIREKPYITDFSTLPGGGMIVPANPMFIALDSAGFVAAGVMDVIIYYTMKALSDADYVELIQSIIPMNI